MKTSTNPPSRTYSHGLTQDLDPVIFQFLEDNTHSPSVEIEKLLISLTLKKLDFFTSARFDAQTFLKKTCHIDSVSLTGKPNYIQTVLRELLPKLAKYLDTYVSGEEGQQTKAHELMRSKWLIKEFQFTTKMDFSHLYHPDVKYMVHFTQQNKWILMPLSQLTFSEEVKSDLALHQAIRWEFLDLLVECLEMQSAKLNAQAAYQANHKFPANSKRELELLEVWTALVEIGFLDHIDKNRRQVLAELRCRFFDVFNLSLTDFNDKHKELKRKKPKAVFLQALTNVMEDLGTKKK